MATVILTLYFSKKTKLEPFFFTLWNTPTFFILFTALKKAALCPLLNLRISCLILNPVGGKGGPRMPPFFASRFCRGVWKSCLRNRYFIVCLFSKWSIQVLVTEQEVQRCKTMMQKTNMYINSHTWFSLKNTEYAPFITSILLQYVNKLLLIILSSNTFTFKRNKTFFNPIMQRMPAVILEYLLIDKHCKNICNFCSLLSCCF